MLRTTLLSVVLSALALSPAFAEDDPPLTTLLGAGAWHRPAYNGADTSHYSLIPVIRHYGKTWFARTTFGMLEGGARMEVLDGLTLGGQIAYEGGRDSNESALLSTHNIATLDPSLSWGVHAELEKQLGIMPVIALLRFRQDIQKNRGAQADFRLTAGIYGNYGLNAGIFAQTTWANKTSGDYYYGISAEQSASSGLAVFEARSGAIFNAFGLLWSYDLSPRWMLLGSVESRQVRDAVTNSPLVQTSTNSYASLGLAYQY